MRYIVVVRGQLKSASQQEARAIHDAILEQLPLLGRPLGAIGHQPYLSPQNPSEFLAVDTWTSLEGLQTFMSDANVAVAFGNLFAGPPDVTVWSESGWSAFYDG